MEEEVFKEVEVGTTCNLRPCLAFYAAFLSLCVCVCVCVCVCTLSVMLQLFY